MLLSSYLQLVYTSELLSYLQLCGKSWLMPDFEFLLRTECGTTTFRRWIIPKPGDFNFPCLPVQKGSVWPSAQYLKQCQQWRKFFSLHFLNLRYLLWSILPKAWGWVLTVRDFSWLSISDILLSNLSNNFVKFLFDVDESLSLWCSKAEKEKHSLCFSYFWRQNFLLYLSLLQQP